MVWQYNPYVWLPTAAATLSAALAAGAWRRRKVHGAPLFIASMLVSVVWSLTYALQLASADLPSAFLWLRTQMVGPFALPLFWLALILQYTGHKEWLTPIRLGALAAIPVISALLLYTEKLPGLMALDAYMETTGPFAVIHVTPGPAFYVHIGYTYLLMFASFILLASKTSNLPPAYRRQPLAMLVGLLCLIVWNGLYMAGLFPHLPVNPTTLVSAMAHMFFAWGIFRYRLLDIMPVARVRVIEAMPDGLIVLDAQRNVVDVNPAAQRIFAISGVRAIGQSGDEVFRAWPDLVRLWATDVGGQADLALGAAGARRLYEARVSPLPGSSKQALGTLVTLRDITARAEAERERERLIQELQTALAEVKTLSGLLRICAWCGKIRDDKGEWVPLDLYVAQQTDAEFTHGICPECRARYEHDLAQYEREPQ